MFGEEFLWFDEAPADIKLVAIPAERILISQTFGESPGLPSSGKTSLL